MELSTGMINRKETYEPTYESVHKHKVPQWFEDSKFGIFIHWSLFSVPGFAGEQHQDIVETFQNDMEGAIKNYPYAEWYLNSLRISGSVTQAFHEKHYPNRTYFSFQKDFEEQNRNFDVREWVRLIQSAGARYLVFVTKHHDGYSLWPTANPNPKMPGYHSKRDFVGELCQEGRAAGLKVGLYYSGVFDWTYKTEYPIDGAKNFLWHQDMPKEYIDYAVSQLKELIDRYQPSVLWNDIGFPYGYDLNELFAYYYNQVEDGVIDDRWGQIKVPQTPQEWQKWEEGLKGHWIPDMPGTKPHYDFITPEYRELAGVSKEKWECTRGIGRSFGFNRTEAGTDYLSGKQILDLLIRVVSKNGNLLLNIGPRADGSVPFEQVKPLQEVGRWLSVNGEAIYGTRPNEIPQCADSQGNPVYFTKNKEAVFAISLLEELPKRFRLHGAGSVEGKRVTLLGTGEVPVDCTGDDMEFLIPDSYRRQSAYVFRIDR